jgi:hypothetical protein
MPMNSEEWNIIKARIEEMEQIVRALRKLRAGTTALPDSVLNALDSTISENENLIGQLKQTMVN